MNPKTDDAAGKKPSEILGSIDLWLDNYDDVFSDFDPRDYPERAISGDFVNELVLRSREQQREEISFRLSVPKERRNREAEQVINERLKEYFRVLASTSKRKSRKSKKFGALLAGAGALVYFGTLALESRFPAAMVVRDAVEVFCWFSMWEGARQLVIEKDPHVEKAALYARFAKAEYEFLSQEDLLASITRRSTKKGARARIADAIAEVEGKVSESQPVAPAVPEPPAQPAAQAESPPLPKIVPRNHGDKELFDLLKKLSGKPSKNKADEMEQAIHSAKAQIVEGKAMSSILSACIIANPSDIRNALEGIKRDSEEAETLRKIAITGFLLGIPEFRHLSNALASLGILEKNDMRRCADPFVSRLEHEARQKVSEDLPAILDLIKKSAIVEAGPAKAFPRPPERKQEGPLPPGVTPIRRQPGN